jgi:TolB protein
METDPNGLYAPVLSSTRNSNSITLEWHKPFCNYCGGCPCPLKEPDYFEIYMSDVEFGKYDLLSRVPNGQFTYTVNNLETNKPKFFKIKAVKDDRLYTISKTIMSIPGETEIIHPLFENVNESRTSGSWSPDMSRVAYISEYVWNNGANSTQSLFISPVNATTGELIQINAYAPKWSPDGTNIVYHTDNEETLIEPGYRPTHIALYNTTNNTIKKLTTGYTFDYRATWSPDGKWIAYLSDASKTNEYNIWKVNKDGGKPIQINKDFNDLNDLGIKTDRSPKILSWSQDGTKIAFSRLTNPENYNQDIFTINSDGSGSPEFLVSTKWNDFCPAYSPDGKSLAFLSDRSGNTEIWLMDLFSGQLTQITGSSGSYIDGELCWSASGKQIIYTGADSIYFKLFSVEIN